MSISNHNQLKETGRYVILAVTICFLLTVNTGWADEWKETDSMKYARHSVALVNLHSGKVLAVGGTHSNDPCELFDPLTETWSTTATTKGNFYNPGVVVLESGKVLACGGQRGGAYTNASEIYDPETGEWEATGLMVDAREFHGLVELPNGLVLAAGGNVGGGQILSSCEIFDPDTNAWRQTDSMEYPRSFRGSSKIIMLDSKMVLAAGGLNVGPNVATNTFELFDYSIEEWITTPTLTMSRERKCYGITELEDKEGRVLVAGGQTRDDPLAFCEVYDPTTDSWTDVASMIHGRFAHIAILLNDGRVLIAGGHDGSSPLQSCEIYHPINNEWSVTADMKIARAFSGWLQAVKLNDGRVLIAGSDYRKECEIFIPDTFTPRVWIKRSPVQHPSARGAFAAAYDADRRRMVIFGGYNYYPLPEELYNDTWEYDGNDWIEVATSTAPSPRLCAGMVYDASRARVVLFGGNYFGGTDFGDTWEYYDSDWHQVSPPTSPSPRTGVGLAYDSTRDRVVLFSGLCADGSRSSETWEYYNGDWHLVTSSGPAPRSFHCMTFDASRNRVLIFGGDPGGGSLHDTWEYDGVSWTQILPAVSPPK